MPGRFHLLLVLQFVSNFQMQVYYARTGLPTSMVGTHPNKKLGSFCA